MHWYWYLIIWIGILGFLLLFAKDARVELQDLEPYWVRRLFLVITAPIGLVVYLFNIWFSILIWTPLRQLYEEWFKKNW